VRFITLDPSVFFSHENEMMLKPAEAHSTVQTKLFTQVKLVGGVFGGGGEGGTSPSCFNLFETNGGKGAPRHSDE